MGKKRVKPGQLRRVGGVMVFSMSVGMLLALLFPAFSIFLAIIFLLAGFYFIFM